MTKTLIGHCFLPTAAVACAAGFLAHLFTAAPSQAWTVYSRGLLKADDITGAGEDTESAFKNNAELERPSFGQRLEFMVTPRPVRPVPDRFTGNAGTEGASHGGPVRFDVLSGVFVNPYFRDYGPGPIGFVDADDPLRPREGLGITFETRFHSRPRAYAGYGEPDYILKMYLDPNISPTGPVRTLGAEFSPFRRSPDVKLRIIGGTDYSRGGGGPGGSVGVEFDF